MTITEINPEPVAITLSAPVNVRDLGGIAVTGGRVREGLAIRADDLSTVTPEVAEALVADGLRAVIDLRSIEELELTGRGPLGTESSLTYHHIPFMADIGDAKDGDLVLEQHLFGELYLRMFENAAHQIVSSLAVIAHAPGTVAFHCSAGQDRTGVLAASLLLALGADDEQIVADYARTGASSEAIRKRLAPTLAPLMLRYGYDLNDAARAALRADFSDAPMRTLLDTLQERYGDRLAPLRAAGLTDALIAQLRDRAVVRS